MYADFKKLVRAVIGSESSRAEALLLNMNWKSCLHTEFHTSSISNLDIFTSAFKFLPLAPNEYLKLLFSRSYLFHSLHEYCPSCNTTL